MCASRGDFNSRSDRRAQHATSITILHRVFRRRRRQRTRPDYATDYARAVAADKAPVNFYLQVFAGACAHVLLWLRGEQCNMRLAITRTRIARAIIILHVNSSAAAALRCRRVLCAGARARRNCADCVRSFRLTHSLANMRRHALHTRLVGDYGTRTLHGSARASAEHQRRQSD